jgi:hypothetical protein
MGYLRALAALEPSIASAGGKTVIITAEPEVHLEGVRTATGYNGAAIVDTENLLAAHLKKRNFVDVAITEKKGYDHGMAQPAVLVLRKDGTVLESWAIIPSAVCAAPDFFPTMSFKAKTNLTGFSSGQIANEYQMNMGGATDRPLLNQIWENVEAKLHGKTAVHARYTKWGALQLLAQKLFGSRKEEPVKA